MKKARLITKDDKDWIVLTFNKISRAEFDKIQKWVSGLPKGRRSFNMKTKEWTVLCSEENYENIRLFNFDLPSDLVRKMSNLEVDESWKLIEIPEQYDYLYDDQKDVMRFILGHDGKGIIGSGLGSGKSNSSLSVLDYCEEFPAIIFCPSTLKYNWLKQHQLWINKPDRIKIIETKDDLIDYEDSIDIAIVNYQLVALGMKKVKTDKGGFIFLPTKELQDFRNNYFNTIIGDEIHKCKSEESQTSNAVRYIAEGAPIKMLLTATPFQNSSKELYPLLNMLDPENFNNYYRFCKRYCKEKDRYVGNRKVQGTFYSSRNEEELNLILSNYMIRQTQKEIKEMRGEDFLEPNISFLPIPIKQTKKYQSAEFILSDGVKNNDDKKTSLGKLSKLRKECWSQKKKACLEFIEDLHESCGEKVIIYAHHKTVIEDLKKHFKDKLVFIDGSVDTSGDIRDNVISEFINNDKVYYIALSIGSSAEGVDGLQRVTTVMCFLEWPWTMGTLEQAYGRISNRTGAIGRANIYHLMACGEGEITVEELFLKILDRKNSAMKKIVDGEDVSEDETLQYILNYYKNRGKNEIVS